MKDQTNRHDGYGGIARDGQHVEEHTVYDLTPDEHYDSIMSLPGEVAEQIKANLDTRGRVYELRYARDAAREVVYSLIKLGADTDMILQQRKIYQDLRDALEEEKS